MAIYSGYFAIKNGGSFHSYVSLPEGIPKKYPKMKKHVWFGTVKSSKSFKFIGYIIQKQ